MAIDRVCDTLHQLERNLMDDMWLRRVFVPMDDMWLQRAIVQMDGMWLRQVHVQMDNMWHRWVEMRMMDNMWGFLVVVVWDNSTVQNDCW